MLVNPNNRTNPTSNRLRSELSVPATCGILDHRVESHTDQRIDDAGRALTTPQMLAHSGKRHLGKEELRTPQVRGSVMSERETRKKGNPVPALRRLRRDRPAQRLWPLPQNEIVPMIEH